MHRDETWMACQEGNTQSSWTEVKNFLCASAYPPVFQPISSFCPVRWIACALNYFLFLRYTRGPLRSNSAQILPALRSYCWYHFVLMKLSFWSFQSPFWQKKCWCGIHYIHPFLTCRCLSECAPRIWRPPACHGFTPSHFTNYLQRVNSCWRAWPRTCAELLNVLVPRLEGPKTTWCQDCNDDRVMLL